MPKGWFITLDRMLEQWSEKQPVEYLYFWTNTDDDVLRTLDILLEAGALGVKHAEVVERLVQIRIDDSLARRYAEKNNVKAFYSNESGGEWRMTDVERNIRTTGGDIFSALVEWKRQILARPENCAMARMLERDLIMLLPAEFNRAQFIEAAERVRHNYKVPDKAWDTIKEVCWNEW